MRLNEYQERAIETAIYPGKGHPTGLMYVALKMNGEAGEFAEHTGKAIRDENFGVLELKLRDTRKDVLVKEVGDVLWYLAAACGEMGITLEDAAQINLDKLASRKERGVLGGSGDNR